MSVIFVSGAGIVNRRTSHWPAARLAQLLHGVLEPVGVGEQGAAGDEDVGAGGRRAGHGVAR